MFPVLNTVSVGLTGCFEIYKLTFLDPTGSLAFTLLVNKILEYLNT